MRLLLDAGADPSKVGQGGNTPFRHDEYGHHKGIIDILKNIPSL